MDNTRKTMLALGLVISVAKYAFVICDGIHWTEYHYNGNTGHKHTPNEKVVQSKVEDPVACSKLCHIEGSCISFSYQPDTRKCTGCSTLHCGAEPADSSEDSAITMFFSTTEESSGPAQSARLTDGKRMTEGRLEVEYNGQWGTVCNDSFGTEEAMVACKMLNYITKNPKTYQSVNFGQSSLPILLGSVSCSGSEKNLLECSHRAWGENSCSHGGDVGISCPPSASVRLTEGKYQYQGKLEVEYDGQSGRVCEDGFGEKEATVVCNMLNLTWATAGTIKGNIGDPSDPPSIALIRLGGVSCSGSEEDLLECSHRAWGDGSCSGGAVGITCAPNMQIRLIPLNESLQKSGRVEVSLDGVQWGTLCRSAGEVSLGVYDMEAQVLCRMLGYKNGGDLIVGKPGSLPILRFVSGFSCTGSEESILLCIEILSDVQKCTHDDDVSVTCL